jgi:hypothetical protein
MAKYQDTPEYKAATEAQLRHRDALVEEIRQRAAGKRRQQDEEERRKAEIHEEVRRKSAPRLRAEKAQVRCDVATHAKAIEKALAAGQKRKADVRALLEDDLGHGFGIQNFNAAWKEIPESLKMKVGAPPK